jgi:hypothetical protein
VRGDASPDALTGRVENLVTGQQREFASGQELLASIACDLRPCGDRTPNARPKRPSPSIRESIVMTTSARQLCDSHDVSAKVTKLVQTRTKLALDRYNGRVKEAYERAVGAAQANPVCRLATIGGAAQYAVDFVQRSILFWDTLRQRGNNFLEHERQGLPPVLHFEYETILDGRSLKRPVNYALLRIVPPKGVTVDPIAALT